MRLRLALVFVLCASGWAQLAPCLIETVAGGSNALRGEGGPATEAELFNPARVAEGPDGLLYFADRGHRRIRRILADGTIETIAGSGSRVFSGDGGAAIEAGLPAAGGLAFGIDGSLYFADNTFGEPAVRAVIRRIDPNGIITTIAGAMASGFSGDGGLARDAGIRGRRSVTAALDGSVYFAAVDHIRRITPEGRIELVAGGTNPDRSDRTRMSTGDGGPALEAELRSPTFLRIDAAGVIYFLESSSPSRIRRILPTGIIETYAGPFSENREDGALRGEFLLSNVTAIGLDGEGRLYWLESDRGIRRFNAEDRVETVWGGDGAPTPGMVRVARDGTLYSTSGHQIFRLIGQAEREVVAGLGPIAPRGDGGPALEATLSPQELAVGPSGEIFVANDTFHRIRVIRNGVVENFAGNGVRADRAIGGPAAGDGGLAADASFNTINDLAAGPDGSVFVADRNRVRRIDPNGVISSYAGDGQFNCPLVGRFRTCGDGGPASDAQTPSVTGIVVDDSGVLYILHNDRSRGGGIWVRKVALDGTISTLPPSPLSDANRRLRGREIGYDGSNLLIVEQTLAGFHYWRVSPDDQFELIEGASDFLPGFPPPRPIGDGAGAVFSASSPQGNVYRIMPDLIVNRIAGSAIGERAFSGDGGPAAEALLGSVGGVSFSPEGDLYISDSRNGRVRRINRPDSCPAIAQPLVANGGILNATFGARLAPGQIFTLFGVRLGPDQAVGARIGDDGRLTSELGGTRVLIDGVPAVLTFVSRNQVNGIIPYRTVVSGHFVGSAEVSEFSPDRVFALRVEVDGTHAERGLSIDPTAPGLFAIGDNLAAALNEDGSLNSGVNPARPGSVVVLFGTGEGLTDPPGVDGLIAGDTLPRPVADSAVTIGGQPAEILYLGAAPGLVAGVFQANVRIAASLDSLGAVLVQLRIGRADNRRQQVRIIVGE